MGDAYEGECVHNSSARPSDSSKSTGLNAAFDPSALDTLKSRSRKSRKEEWDSNCNDIEDILNGRANETVLDDDATIVSDWRESGGSHSDENVHRVSEWSRQSCFRKGCWKARRGGRPKKNWFEYQPDKNQLRVCHNTLADSLRGVHAFSFQKRHARLDWRMLHAIDVDQILCDTDIDKLEAVLDTIAFGNIMGEDTRNFTESNFIKIFRLSQLMIEYLLHVQEILVAHKTQLMEAGLEFQNRGEKYRNHCALQQEALKQARRELKQARKTIKTYEALLRSKEVVPSPAPVPVVATQPATQRAHHCPFCDKVFETVVYLDLHIARRHSKATDNLLEQKINAVVSKAEESTAARLKTETEALQNEVQRLRAASQINISKSEAVTPCQVALLQSSLHENSEKLMDVQHQLQMLQTMIHPLNPRMDKSERLEEKKAEVAHEKLRELEIKFVDFEGQIKQLAQENAKLLKELNSAYYEVSGLKSEKQRFISSLDQRDEQMDVLQKEIQQLRKELKKFQDSGQQSMDRRPTTIKKLPQQTEAASEDEVDMDNPRDEPRRVWQPDDGRLAIVKRLRMEDVQVKLTEESHEEKTKKAGAAADCAVDDAEDESLLISPADREKWLAEHSYTPIPHLPYVLAKFQHLPTLFTKKRGEISQK